MDWALKLLATVSAALFTSWALYISLVEHPARMRAGVAVALAEFRTSYRRAAPWQATSAALSLLAGGLVSAFTAEWVWALGGLAVGAVIPFTLLVIMPTNHLLLGPALPAREAERLLQRWGRLHWVRSVLGLVGLLVFSWRICGR
jgi:hypothetical protein